MQQSNTNAATVTALPPELVQRAREIWKREVFNRRYAQPDPDQPRRGDAGARPETA